MDKIYNHKKVEEKIYKMWEKNRYFIPKTDPSASHSTLRDEPSGSDSKSSGQAKKPFSIILPPPNANAPLHFGHAMYVAEDILIRYHRMKGDSTLWLPGIRSCWF